MLSAVFGLIMGFWGAVAHTPSEPLSGPIDQIVIDKSDRTLMAYQDGRLVRSYPMSLGFAPDGDKLRQGDGRTPEGVFRINRRNPNSQFHLSLGIDYPQPDDIARARRLGVSAGGDIFIHGQPPGIFGLRRIALDWTAGCVALTNVAMEELWAVTPVGTKVVIRP